jgi:F-type H+-transporting ATPase subunit epsilon
MSEVKNNVDSSSAAQKNNNEIRMKIVSETGETFRGFVKSISVPSFNGEITVLPNHIPIISKLRDGVVIANDVNGTGHKFKIATGFLMFNNNSCLITVEQLEEISNAA